MLYEVITDITTFKGNVFLYVARVCTVDCLDVYSWMIVKDGLHYQSFMDPDLICHSCDQDLIANGNGRIAGKEKVVKWSHFIPFLVEEAGQVVFFHNP